MTTKIKKPSHPNKPHEPTKPSKFFTTSITMGNISYIVKSIFDIIENAKNQIAKNYPKEIFDTKRLFVEQESGYDYDDGNTNIYYTLEVEKDNKFFQSEMNKYNKLYKNYTNKLLDFNKKLEQYNKDKIIYDKLKKQEELEKKKELYSKLKKEFEGSVND